MRNTVAVWSLALMAYFTSQVQAAIPEWVPGRDFLIARQIESWNAKNKSKVQVELQRMGFYVDKLGWTLLGLTGKVENNSDATVDAVIIDYIVSNKRTGTEAFRLRLALSIRIFQTANISLQKPFKEDPKYIYKLLRKSNGLTEAKAVWEQLGEDAQWSYQFVAAMPQAILKEYSAHAYYTLQVDELTIEATP